MKDKNTPARRMQDHPEEERPRERLVTAGAGALKDAELLAILFRTGSREFNALRLAEELVHEFRDLRGVARASLEELQQVKGVGRVKAIEIKAALELGLRLATHHNRNIKDRMDRPEAVHSYLKHRFKEYETEHFVALLLNTKNELLRPVEISHGGLDETVAAPRDVFRQAVREGASGVVVAHNHPSGDPEPSRADLMLTQRLKEAADIIGVRLLDHVIFGDGDRYVSLKERGQM